LKRVDWSAALFAAHPRGGIGIVDVVSCLWP
jgi:hypothetical protein